MYLFISIYQEVQWWTSPPPESSLPEGYSMTHPTIIIHSVKGGGQQEGSLD